MLRRLEAAPKPPTKQPTKKADMGEKAKATKPHSDQVGGAKALTSPSEARDLECPFCASRNWRSVAELEQHVATHMGNETEYPRPDPAPVSVFAASDEVITSGNSPNHASAREVCPTCSARFVSAVELVDHFERMHSGRRPTSSRNLQPSTGKCEIN